MSLNGREYITTPGGMKYKLLVLDESTRQMSLPVLRKINELVQAGAIVTGPNQLQPQASVMIRLNFSDLLDAALGRRKG